MRRRFVTKPPKIRRLTCDSSGVHTQYVRLYTKGHDPEQSNDQRYEPCISGHEGNTSESFIQPNQPVTSVEDPQSDTVSRYEKKCKKVADGWRNIREKLLEIRTEEMAPSTYHCVKCNAFQEDIIRCIDCSAVAYYCHTCCTDVHSTVLFHVPCIWKKVMFVPLKRGKTVLKRLDHQCESLYTREICTIDTKGVQHKTHANFCKCESEPVTVLRYGLWPGTPEMPNVLFQLDLMEMCAVLQTESHLSVRSFCDTLKYLKRYQIHDVKEVKDIYRVLVGDCSNEYRYHRTIFDSGKHLDLSNDTCPACNEDLSNRVLCVDANFGLVHKKSSAIGQGLENVRHDQNNFFLNQDDVDRFVNSYQNPQKTQECSSFQAGSALRSKVKNVKLDVTGVFGSVCKHDLPLKFCNLRHGERLAYAVYFMKCFNTEQHTGRSVFMYDIGCVLHKHLLRNNNTELTSNFTFSVPVFHSFAHNMQCQLIYGQRNVDGTCLADGEGTERLWSYLRSFSKMTKEMSLDNRHDLMVDALYHYSGKLKTKLPGRILSKYLKALSQKEESLKALENFWKDNTDSFKKAEKLYEERKKKAIISNYKGDVKISNEEEYCWLLFQAVNLRNNITEDNDNEDCKNDLQNELDRIERQLVKAEKQAHISQRWNITDERCCGFVESYKWKKKKNLKKCMKTLAVERCYLLSMMKKYADGQDVAIRVGRQLQSVNRKLMNYLKEIGSFGEPNLSFTDISSPTCSIYEDVDVAFLNKDEMKAADLYASYLRGQEEIDASLSEMKNVFNWIKNQERHVHLKICELENSHPSRLMSGKTFYLLLRKMQLENMQKEVYNLFSPKIEIDYYDTPVVNLVIQNMKIHSFENVISSEELKETLYVIESFENTEAHASETFEDIDGDELIIDHELGYVSDE